MSSDAPQSLQILENMPVQLNLPIDDDSDTNYIAPSDDIIANTTFINELWIIVPTSEIVVKTSIIIPIIIWGVIGNMLLLYVITKNRHLRSSINLLVANMAAADLITLMVHPWIFLTYDFFQNYELGKFGCRMEAGFECAVLLASVSNLVAISYDRLNAIVLPQQRRLTRRGAKITIVLTWVLGFVIATPLFIYRDYKERQWLNFLEKYCTENMVVTSIYWHVIITMLVWFPLGVMLVCYIALFLKLHRYEKVVLRKSKLGNQINVHYTKKIAKMMCTVVLTFILCRIPLTVLIFYRNKLLRNSNVTSIQQVQNQVNGEYYVLWLTSRYMILLNAAINPLIYGMTNEKFRKAIMDTKVAKWIKIHAPKTNKNSKIKTKQKERKTKKIDIFLIFKSKFFVKKEPIVETNKIDCKSNLPISRLKANKT